MRLLVNSLLISLVLIPSVAQTTTPGGPKPRVFISDSQSWEMSGNAGGSNGTFAAHSASGARPQTAEIVKTFGQRVPTSSSTTNRTKQITSSSSITKAAKAWSSATIRWPCSTKMATPS